MATTNLDVLRLEALPDYCLAIEALSDHIRQTGGHGGPDTETLPDATGGLLLAINRLAHHVSCEIEAALELLAGA